jgi:hypothetical protein
MIYKKYIWLFSKTNSLIYLKKYCSRAAAELIKVLTTAAGHGKQLINLIFHLPNHLLKIVFIFG